MAGEKLSPAQLYSSISASVGGLVVGSILGYASPATLQLRDSNFLNSSSSQFNKSGAATYSGSIGGLVGSLLGIVLLRTIGRRLTIILAAIVALLGWIIIGVSANFGMLVVGRLLNGAYIGTAVTAVVTYIGETTPAHSRGLLGTLFPVLLGVGSLFSIAIGGFTTWYELAFINGSFAFVFVILMFFNIESPVYLLSKGKENEAISELKKLLVEDAAVSAALSELKAFQKKGEENSFMWSELRAYHVYAPIGVCLLLMVAQQTCGANALMFNINFIFKSTGTDISPYLSSVLSATVMAVCTLGATFLVERVGRKLLIVMSCIVTSLSFGFIGLFFFLLSKHHDWTVQYLSWLPLLSVVVFSAAFQFGLGPVVWVVVGEVSPPNLREVTSGVATFVSSIAVFLVAFSFEPINMSLPPYGFYWIYACINFCMGVIFMFVMKETKGKTLEQIAAMYQKN